MFKKPTSYLVARAFEIYIGLYFIAGAIPKALNIDGFTVQLAAYNVIERPVLLMVAALFTLFVEISLGVALLLKLRLRGLTLAALQGLLVFFTALIIYSWRMHGLEDCGCFPVFQMSPPVSITKNTLMFFAGGYMWWGLFRQSGATARDNGADRPIPRTRIRGAILKVACSACLALVALAYAWQDIDHAVLAHDDSRAEKGFFAQFSIEGEQGQYSLGEGLYLVPVISTSCPECLQKAPELNDLVMMPGVPPIVALCYEEVPGGMDSFRSFVMPLFDLHSIGDRSLLYFTLIDQDPFRVILVKDGRQVYVWDGYVPDYEEVIGVLDALDIAF